MDFTWIDYPAQYEDEIETWCDESVVGFALDGDSVKAEHQWYLDSDNFAHNSNYFCKIALDGETPIALLMLAIYDEKIRLTENFIYIDTFIIKPVLRNQGYGTRILSEVITHIDQLIGSTNNILIAQIHKDNDISKKLFNKLGFHFIYTDAEANDDWFDWVFPPSAADRYLTLQNE